MGKGSVCPVEGKNIIIVVHVTLSELQKLHVHGVGLQQQREASHLKEAASEAHVHHEGCGDPGDLMQNPVLAVADSTGRNAQTEDPAKHASNDASGLPNQRGSHEGQRSAGSSWHHNQHAQRSWECRSSRHDATSWHTARNKPKTKWQDAEKVRKLTAERWDKDQRGRAEAALTAKRTTAAATCLQRVARGMLARRGLGTLRAYAKAVACAPAKEHLRQKSSTKCTGTAGKADEELLAEAIANANT